MADGLHHGDLKWILLAIALWNTMFCTSGAVFGFASLDIPTQVFVISGGAMLSLSNAVVGPCVDIFGPRLASICGSALAGIGYVLLAFVTPGEASIQAYVSLGLVTWGGIGPYLGSFSVASLFASPEIPIAAITGLFCLAGLGYDLLGRFGFDRRSICFIYAALQVLGVGLSALGVPSKPHLIGTPRPVLFHRMFGIEPRPDPRGQDTVDRAIIERPVDALESRGQWLLMPSFWERRRRQLQRGMSFRDRARRLSRRLSEIRSESVSRDLSSASFLAQAMSVEYLGMVVWYTLNLTWMLYFFTYAGPQVNNKTFCGLVSWIGNILPALMAFFVGASIARFGWGVSTFMTSLVSMGMFLLITVDSMILNYVALLLFTVSRSLIFAIFFSYIPVTFGPSNYGRLIGMATFVSGCFGFINNAVAEWAGFIASPDSVCSTGLVCGTREACNRASYILAATFLPLLLYSFWLWRNRAKDGLPLSPSSPESSPPGSPDSHRNPMPAQSP